MTTTNERPINRQAITTLTQAFSLLGITKGISSQNEINAAFRAKVRAAATRPGNYSGDMDALTQAKDLLTAALTKALEQAGIDQARQRAKQEEQDERERAKARQREQEKAKEEATRPQPVKPKPEPLRLGPGSRSHEARRAYELQQAQQREQARRVWTWHVGHEQARTRQQRQGQYKRGGEIIMQQPGPVQRDGQELQQPDQTGDDTIQGTLQLFRQRQAELQQTRQQEQAMQEALSCVQAQRQQLETTIQTANVVAEQLRTILAEAGATYKNGEPDV